MSCNFFQWAYIQGMEKIGFRPAFQRQPASATRSVAEQLAASGEFDNLADLDGIRASIASADSGRYVSHEDMEEMIRGLYAAAEPSQDLGTHPQP